jgi:hypothetical protein
MQILFLGDDHKMLKNKNFSNAIKISFFLLKKIENATKKTIVENYDMQKVFIYEMERY